LQAVKMAVNDLKTSAILLQMDTFTYTTTRNNTSRNYQWNFTLSLSLIKHKNDSSCFLLEEKHSIGKKRLQLTLQNKVANNIPSLNFIKGTIGSNNKTPC